MRKTSVTTAIDQVTGPVSAESLPKDTLQEAIEDLWDPDQGRHQDHLLQSEERDQEKDLQLSTTTDRAIKDLFQEVLLSEKKRFLKRQSQSLSAENHPVLGQIKPSNLSIITFSIIMTDLD